MKCISCYDSSKHLLNYYASLIFNLYVLNKYKFKKVIPFHKECIITEDDNLPETNLVIPSPMPKVNKGGISLILK